MSPVLSTTSALTMENIKVTVGIAGCCGVTAIHFVIPILLAYFSQKNTQEKSGVYGKHGLPFQHNLWVMLDIIFALFAINIVSKRSY